MGVFQSAFPWTAMKGPRKFPFLIPGVRKGYVAAVDAVLPHGSCWQTRASIFMAVRFCTS